MQYAGHAEVALSEWMRYRSLTGDPKEQWMLETFECCGGPNETGKHLEGCPRLAEEEAEALSEAYE